MNLVHEVYLPVFLPELVFGVHQDKAHPCGYLRTSFIYGPGVFLYLGIILFAYDALGDDLLSGYVLVMSCGSLGCRCDDRLRELLVLHHPFRHLHPADCTPACLVLSPRMSGQIPADHHLHFERLALVPYSDHRVRDCYFPVRKDVGCGIQELRRYLVEHLPLERDTFGEDHIECGNPVSGHHDEIFPADVIYITHFSCVFPCLPREMEISLYNCFHHSLKYFDLELSSKPLQK